MKRQTEISIRQRLEDLHKERENWEATAFKTSNHMLYGILQQCYTLEQSMGTEQRSELNDYCRQRGISTNSSTNAIAKVIKCVFTIDRRRVSTYVMALQAAKENNVASDALADWIEEEGGLLEISLRRSSNYKSDAQRAEEAKQALRQQPVLATVDSVELTAKYDFKGSEDAVLLLATRNPSGYFDIRQVIQSESVISAALRTCYKKAISQKHAALPEVDLQVQSLDAVDSVSAQLAERLA